jgi:lipopolysaccharide biosynthesis glycosyltransferase
MEFIYQSTNDERETVKLKASDLGVPVCYCFDKKYANFTAVSSFSLHSNSLIPPKIFWVVPARDFDYCLQLLTAVNKFGMNITLIKLNAEHFVGWQGHNTAYYRLLLPQLIDVDKIIYIDSDTLAMTDLKELFNHDLTDALLAGVVDPGGHTSKIFHHLEKQEPYLNAGLLLMNLKLMRELNFVEACKRVYFKFKDEINYGDQDVINLVAVGRKLSLNSKFCRLMQTNDETYANFEKASNENDVIHFVGGIKPWMRCCNPKIFEHWWKYADKLAINDLVPEEITSVMHVLFLAQVHDINGEFQDASRWKSKAIELFMRGR